MAGKFLYLPENSITSGPLTQFTIVVGGLDVMFIMGALSELAIPENWDVDTDVDLGTLAVEEFRAGIAEYFESLMESIEASRVEL